MRYVSKIFTAVIHNERVKSTFQPVLISKHPPQMQRVSGKERAFETAGTERFSLSGETFNETSRQLAKTDN